MSQFGERADAVQGKLDSLRAELHMILAEAGSHLQGMDADAAAEAGGTKLAELQQRERDVAAQILTVEAGRDRIREIEGQIAAAKARTSELRAEIKGLSENIEPIFEEIGQLAFDVYRGNPLVDQEYASIFSALVEVNSELSGIDASIADQQVLLEEKPFLEKMVVRGRIALLKNRRATREGSFRRLVRSAGSEIMGTGFVDEIADPKLTAAAETYRERLKTTRKLEEELGVTGDSQHAMESDLERICLGKRPQKRFEELGDDAVTLLQTRDAIRVEMALSVRTMPAAALPAKCKPLFKKAAAMEKRVTAAEEVASRLRAAIGVEQLQTDAEELNREITRNERRQAELKRQITALKKSRTEMSQRLDELQAVRGSADDLLAEDLLNDL